MIIKNKNVFWLFTSRAKEILYKPTNMNDLFSSISEEFYIMQRPSE